jgi:tight adherence protein B
VGAVTAPAGLAQAIPAAAVGLALLLFRLGNPTADRLAAVLARSAPAGEGRTSTSAARRAAPGRRLDRRRVARRGRAAAAGAWAQVVSWLLQRTARMAAAVAACTAAVVVAVGGAALAAAAALAIGALALVGADRVRSRALDRADRELVTGLTVLGAELQAGAQARTALAAAAEAAPSCADGLLRAAAGQPGAETATLLAQAPRLRPLACVWRMADACGAAPATLVSKLADDARERLATRNEVRMALAGARSSAALLAVLPVLGLLLGAAMQANPLGVLFGTRPGRLLCLLGTAFDVAGVMWTRRLARRAEPP